MEYMRSDSSKTTIIEEICRGIAYTCEVPNYVLHLLADELAHLPCIEFECCSNWFSRHSVSFVLYWWVVTHVNLMRLGWLVLTLNMCYIVFNIVISMKACCEDLPNCDNNSLRHRAQEKYHPVNCPGGAYDTNYSLWNTASTVFKFWVHSGASYVFVVIFLRRSWTQTLQVLFWV